MAEISVTLDSLSKEIEDEADQLLLHINMDMSSLINSKDKFDIKKTTRNSS